MSNGLPGPSTLFPSGQARQGYPRNWGNYASFATLPNGAGNVLNANQFPKLQVGDTAYVIGSGQASCTAIGTAGGGDATWVLIPAAPAGGGTDNHIVRWDGTSAFQDGVSIETDAGEILVGSGSGANPSYSFVAFPTLGMHALDVNTLQVDMQGFARFSFNTGGLFGIVQGNTPLALYGNPTFFGGGIVLTAASAYQYAFGGAFTQSAAQINATVAQGGDGAFTGLDMNIIETSAGTGPSYAIDVKAGAAGTTRVFSVTTAGGIEQKAITPAALAAGNIDNYAGFGTSGFGRVTPDGGATSTIRGILATNIGDGHELTLVNIGAAIFTINHQDAGSTAANRIITATGAPIVLTPDDTVILKYDLTTARWRQITSVA